MSLREKVIVKTATIDLQGELVVGADGLPELIVDCSIICTGRREQYRPWTLPAAWTVITKHTFPGILLDAWRMIERCHHDIAEAQREEEIDDRDRAQQREINNRLAEEVDERRIDEPKASR